MFNETKTELSSASIWLQNVRVDGRGFIFALKNNHPIKSIFNSHYEALAQINKLIDDDCEVFVGIGNVLPDAARRIADNVTEVSSVFIDLDCGPNKPYATQIDALDCLVETVTKFEFLQPSLLVDSGGGIHAYWCFNKPVPKEEWLVLADEFKSFWIKNGLTIDPVVTADCSRVMRVPDSYNLKLVDNPRLVSLLLQT